MKPSSPDASITRVPDPKTYTMVEGGGLPPGGIFARRLSPGGELSPRGGGYLRLPICAVCFVPGTSRSDRITPSLRVYCLHWSAVCQRIVFKMAVLV